MRGVLYTTLCDKAYQWLVEGRWISPGIPVSTTNKTDRHEQQWSIILPISTKRLDLTVSTMLSICYWNSSNDEVCFVFHLWSLTPLSTIFHYIVAVSFIGGGNRNTRRVSDLYNCTNAVAFCIQVQGTWDSLNKRHLFAYHSKETCIWFDSQIPVNEVL
jgi:hypothetical protein